MKLRFAVVGLGVSLAALAAPAKPAISAEQARATALRQVPNATVKSQELETEHGRRIWSFDLVQPGKSGVEEVQVDANTGQVVSKTHESPQSERRESQAEHPTGKR